MEVKQPDPPTSLPRTHFVTLVWYARVSLSTGSRWHVCLVVSLFYVDAPVYGGETFHELLY